jgi:hypothetical protein
MAWNWRELQSVLLASKAFMALFAGHDHEGGYAEIDGRHFVTLEAMLEGVATSVPQLCRCRLHSRLTGHMSVIATNLGLLLQLRKAAMLLLLWRLGHQRFTSMAWTQQ